MTDDTVTPKTYSKLSVVVPVFDERNTVAEVIRRIKSSTLTDELDLEIVVVDDGSTDGTDKVLTTIEDSTVRVIRHKTNRGKGAAVRTGISEARGDIIVLQDADLDYSPEDLPRLIAPIVGGRALVVYGSRFHPERETMPLTSVLADRAVSVAAALLFNTTLTDVETGYKAFDRDLIAGITIDSDGFEFEPEITAKILRSGQRIFEVPIRYSGGGVAKRPGSKSRINAVKTLVGVRFRKTS